MLAGNNWLVEPLHVTNLLAVKRGILPMPVLEAVMPDAKSEAAPEASDPSSSHAHSHSAAEALQHALYTPSAPVVGQSAGLEMQ